MSAWEPVGCAERVGGGEAASDSVAHRRGRDHDVTGAGARA